MMDRGNKRMRKMRERMRHRDSVTSSNMGLTVMLEREERE